jgi:hypothetical protein
VFVVRCGREGSGSEEYQAISEPQNVPAISTMSDKPTTGEWTVKPAGSETWAVYEGSQLIGNAWDKMEAESIAHCHNAALAAAYQKGWDDGQDHARQHINK